MKQWIVHSASKYSSPVVAVKKKRISQDYTVKRGSYAKLLRCHG